MNKQVGEIAQYQQMLGGMAVAPVGALAPRVGEFRRVERPSGVPVSGQPYDILAPIAVSVPQPPTAQALASQAASSQPCSTVSTSRQPPLPMPVAQHMGEQLGLPDIHGTYHCGPRQFYWSSCVPVPENNFGIMINAEFPTQKYHLRQEVVFNDEAIRNEHWRQCGALLPRVDRTSEDSISTWLHNHAEYGNAYDVKGVHKQEMLAAPPHQRYQTDYHGLHRKRTDDTIWKQAQHAAHQLEREIMDESGIKDFFGDPAAVAFQRS
mmetsp:Transcript_40002/g.101608  ORF Transcript_40002/g.101608 Transcript_40002/m.101608 type:complete len:265 (-) Transcript_40002:231-1025(-)|eukprot:CAMPEP_0183436326 /NCGR_PEP_ID=MMETSP0370-20130417/69199_1 /TAXON_ID=268820 /ORGANISM="Peridinium aciculiferum, Strain PAER-2" /LENGTH=264 /DNA_ID=CAMNT_0025623733 /DNA_START=82 /DNA_END=876 /DNA_ORIENTATION=+